MRVNWIVRAIALALVVGCSPENSDETGGGSARDTHTTAEAHDHPSQGPHHGTLVELGKEEFHAEVVHTSDSVTVYILDSQAKAAVPIDAPELVINLVHDGKPEQFRLAATSESGDAPGKASRFTIADAELAAHIDDPAAQPKLSVTIGGKPYRGEIHHDHEGHDHDGHEHGVAPQRP